MDRGNFIFFTVGVAIGFSLSNSIMKKKYEQIVQEELDSIREVYNREKKEEEVVEEEPIEETLGSKLSPTYDTRERYFDYSKPALEDLAKELLPEEEEAPTDEDYPEDEEELADVFEELEEVEKDEEEGDDVLDIVPLKPKEVKDGPYIISDQEFNEYYREHDKLSLMYYVEDDVLCDEHDEMVDDVAYVVGMDALDSFWAMSSDPNVVHIRNEKIGADIEIVRVTGSYQDYVIGG